MYVRRRLISQCGMIPEFQINEHTSTKLGLPIEYYTLKSLLLLLGVAKNYEFSRYEFTLIPKILAQIICSRSFKVLLINFV